MHRAGLHLALRPMGALVALYIARQSAALPLSTLHCHHAVEKMLSRVTSPLSAALPLSTTSAALPPTIISGIAAKHVHHQRHCR